jgi:hypothetical protein
VPSGTGTPPESGTQPNAAESPLPVTVWTTVPPGSAIVAVHVTGSENRATRLRASASPSKFGLRSVRPSIDQSWGGAVGPGVAPATIWSVVRSRLPTIERWNPLVGFCGSMIAV